MDSQPNIDKLRAYIGAEKIIDEAGLGMPDSYWERVNAKQHSSPERKREHNALVSVSPVNPKPPGDPGTLHIAFREYIRWIENTSIDPETGTIKGWGNTQRRQTNRLIERHSDRSIAELDYGVIDEFIRYWRIRPPKKLGDGRVSPATAGNMISQLKRFFDWLHTSRFAWRKPQDYGEIKTTVSQDALEIQCGLEQVDTFSLSELILLNKYATPFERALLLLGLNCGFGAAETASLLLDEVHLHKAHEPRFQEILGCKTTDADSFIKRVRRKNRVYGEFILFPKTVQSLELAIELRKSQPNFCGEARLFLNANGQPYDRPTVSGNRNQQIPSTFARLKNRIQRDGHEISDHSFGKLRKTAGDLVRRHSNGEIAGVFLCHGKAVKTDSLADVYTNRPFGKVFEAIRKVEEFLEPVFAAANDDQ